MLLATDKPLTLPLRRSRQEQPLPPQCYPAQGSGQASPSVHRATDPSITPNLVHSPGWLHRRGSSCLFPSQCPALQPWAAAGAARPASSRACCRTRREHR